MKTKHPGICSNCREDVKAIVVEENNLTRDICECPKCRARILVCRTPGCDNYAKGRESYDEELCFACTAAAGKLVASAAAIASPFVATAVADKVKSKLK